MHGNSTRENRDTPPTPDTTQCTGRLEKAMSPKSSMNAGGESDGRVLPTKYSNKDENPSAESAEERRPTKENTAQATACRTQSRIDASSGLHSVREAAKRDKQLKFTALLHHVTLPLMRDAFYALKREAAAGVDGVTWKE